MRDEELASALEEVRVRVRARYPERASNDDNIRIPDLLPVLHARDAAEGKVGAIGTVNPRRPGLANAAIQWVKRRIARALGWHIRGQVEFNHLALDYMQATLDSLNAMNLAIKELADREQRERQDIHVLRSIGALHASFERRASELEASYRSLATRQHSDFASEGQRQIASVRQALEQLVYEELRLLRQRLAFRDQRSVTPSHESRYIDWLRFANLFRGPEDRIREQQRKYLDCFQGVEEVLDLGCGRGEFLEAAREQGIRARGIDSNAECVSLCRSKGLEAEHADLFAYLELLPVAAIHAVFCSHAIEHLEPMRIPTLAVLLAEKMTRGAVVVFETPNPEHQASFAANFYLDPTHTRAVPARALRFYLEEAGFGNIEFKDGPDYAIIAKRL